MRILRCQEWHLIWFRLAMTFLAISQIDRRLPGRVLFDLFTSFPYDFGNACAQRRDDFLVMLN